MNTKIVFGIILAIMVTGIIISVQDLENPIVKNVKNTENFESFEDIENFEKLGLLIISECMKISSDLTENNVCFNEKINQLESKSPSIKSELRKLGFVLENKTLPYEDLVNDSNYQLSKFTKATIRIDNVILDVQLADTREKRIKGLQFQEKLLDDEGMLFDFQEPKIISMWMPNMKFSLDMIWFDEQGKVIHIEENVEPCLSISDCPSFNGNGQKARYVLEITSGFIDKFNITKNSQLSFKFS